MKFKRFLSQIISGKNLKKMRTAIILFFSCKILFFKCSKPEQTTKQNIENVSVTKNKRAASAQMNASNNKKIEISPIKIKEARLLKNQYSDHKDIKITFKNLGKKDIKAIKFEWFCVNSFEKPASGRFFFAEGRFTENITYLIKSGRSKTEIWEDFSTDANKIIKIRAYYIVYTDGTKWGLDDT